MSENRRMLGLPYEEYLQLMKNDVQSDKDAVIAAHKGMSNAEYFNKKENEDVNFNT